MISNWTGYAVSLVMAFLLGPLVVHTLGDESYGIWSLIVSFTGYYGLFDLGIRGAVSQYVSRYHAQGDLEGIDRTVNTALVLLSCVGATFVVLTFLVAGAMPGWFGVSETLQQETRTALIILGATVAVGIPMATFGSIAGACQRFDISNKVGIATRLLNAALVVTTLKLGMGFVGLACVTAATSVVGWIANLAVARHLMPHLRVSFGLFRRDYARELGHFAGLSFIGRLAAQVVDWTDTIVIGRVTRDPLAITHYSIGNNLVPYYRDTISSAGYALTPVATSFDARGDRDRLRRLYLDGTRWMSVGTGLIGGCLFFLGEDFLRLWMGAKYVAGDRYTSSAVILAILTGGSLVRNLQNSGLQVLNGMRRVGFMAKLMVIEAVLNLGLSIFLCQRYGIVGVALGTLFPAILTQGFLQPFYLGRELGVKFVTYLRNALVGPVVTIALVALLGAAWDRVAPLERMVHLLGKGTVVGLLAGVAGLLAVSTRAERAALRARLSR